MKHVRPPFFDFFFAVNKSRCWKGTKNKKMPHSTGERMWERIQDQKIQKKISHLLTLLDLPWVLALVLLLRPLKSFNFRHHLRWNEIALNLPQTETELSLRKLTCINRISRVQMRSTATESRQLNRQRGSETGDDASPMKTWRRKSKLFALQFYSAESDSCLCRACILSNGIL